MATGDNVLTAIHVGRECGIISGDADVIFGDLAGDGPEECKKIIWKQAKGKYNQIKVEDQNSFEIHKVEDLNNKDEVILREDYPWEVAANKCSIAITGKVFKLLCNEEKYKPILCSILMKGQIFARMAPEEKAVLVENLQSFLKVEIGMCGDGANDCAALKTADIGISLSEAEASIAAPFSSRILDISAVTVLLK